VEQCNITPTLRILGTKRAEALESLRLYKPQAANTDGDRPDKKDQEQMGVQRAEDKSWSSADVAVNAGLDSGQERVGVRPRVELLGTSLLGLRCLCGGICAADLQQSMARQCRSGCISTRLLVVLILDNSWSCRCIILTRRLLQIRSRQDGGG
jgi:hypothetical protein